MRTRFLFLLSFLFSRVLIGAPLPAKYLDWVPSGSASYMVEPSTGLKNTGFTIAKPTFQNMNWNFNLVDSWIKYLKDERDAQAALLLTAGNSITTLSGLISAAESEIDALDVRMTTAESDINALQATALLNPMDTAGDMIYGGSAGVATKLDSGSSGQFLRANGASAPTWASILQLPNASGSVTSPSYSWDSTSSNTGFYLSGTDAIALSSNGTQSWAVDSAGTSTIGVSGSTNTHLVNGQLGVVGVGSVTTPSLAFTGASSDTGFYLVGTDNIGLSSNGVQSWAVNASGVNTIGVSGTSATQTVNGQIGVVSSGSTTTPSYAFTGTSSNTGFYLSGTDAVGLSSNGTQSWNASATGVITTGPSTGGVAHPWRGSLDLTVASGSGTPAYGVNRNAGSSLDFYTNSAVGLSLSSVQALIIGPTAGGVVHGINGDLKFSDTAFVLDANTANGSDTKRLILSGGGGGNAVTQGPVIQLYGNDFGSSAGGVMNFAAGDIADAAGTNEGIQFFGSAAANAASTKIFSLTGNGAVNAPNIHNRGAGNITSGRYLPGTPTLALNVASVAVSSSHYSQVGKTVTVAGTATVTCSSGSAATPVASAFSLSLPVASNLVGGTDLIGTGSKFAAAPTPYAAVYISSDTAGDRAFFDFNCNTTSATDMSYTFLYEVK